MNINGKPSCAIIHVFKLFWTELQNSLLLHVNDLSRPSWSNTFTSHTQTINSIFAWVTCNCAPWQAYCGWKYMPEHRLTCCNRHVMVIINMWNVPFVQDYYLTELNHCINITKPTFIKRSGACPMFYLQLSQVEALTSSHGGQHTGSLFIQDKSPVFIISPGKHNKQISGVVQSVTYKTNFKKTVCFGVHPVDLTDPRRGRSASSMCR